jgi:hypothetical protein
MPVPHEMVTNRVLESWKAKLAESDATLLVLLGLGHDEHSGTVVVCTREGIANDTLLAALLFAVNHIEPGLIPECEKGKRT